VALASVGLVDFFQFRNCGDLADQAAQARVACRSVDISATHRQNLTNIIKKLRNN
jgi:hypothetical protein